MALRDHTLKKEYRSLRNDIVNEFYIPLLKDAVEYHRGVGFFSSSALAEISVGIAEMAKHGGKIKLVCSPILSPEDYSAIEKGYEERDKYIEKTLLQQIENDDEEKDYFTEERLNLLAALIANGTLEMRFAFIKDDKHYGIYHEKVGIIFDDSGDRVAFDGSNNETENGMLYNYETLDVYASWESQDSFERADQKEKAFNDIWNNKDAALDVRKYDAVTSSFIRKYYVRKPNYNIDKEQYRYRDNTVHEPQMPYEANPRGARIPDSVSLFDYQKDAINAWEKNGYRGIFDMATGTGKTYTALGAISRLSENINDKLAVIILCPYKHLVDQWVEDIVKFNIKPIIGHSDSPQHNWKKLLDTAIRDQKISIKRSFFCFICTNVTFTSSYVQEEINKINYPILLVGDEAHNLGAPRIAKLLDDRFQYRLALSATFERYRDETGTATISQFFGNKCIEYSLERAIKEDKLTKYKYYPVITILSEQELYDYQELTMRMAKCIVTHKNGTKSLNSTGKLIALQRARIIAGSSGKLEALPKVMETYKDGDSILVYCGATSVEYIDQDDEEQDDKETIAVLNILKNKLNMKAAKFTYEEDKTQRKMILERFVTKKLQAIVAVKCLDEGLNVPGIRTAFILASTTNPKEYIQRRGRVLRKAEGKDFAEIYDFVTLPRSLGDTTGLTEDQLKKDLPIIKNELRRMKEFAALAINSFDSKNIIWKIEDAYNITDSDLNITGEEWLDNGE
jgi:superfamily II DNA or RNA helicase